MMLKITLALSTMFFVMTAQAGVNVVGCTQGNDAEVIKTEFSKIHDAIKGLRADNGQFKRYCQGTEEQNAQYDATFSKILGYFETNYTVTCDYSDNCCVDSNINYPKDSNGNKDLPAGCAVKGAQSATICAKRLKEGHDQISNYLDHLLTHEMAHSVGHDHTKVDSKTNFPEYTSSLGKICEMPHWWKNPDTFGTLARASYRGNWNAGTASLFDLPKDIASNPGEYLDIPQKTEAEISKGYYQSVESCIDSKAYLAQGNQKILASIEKICTCGEERVSSPNATAYRDCGAKERFCYESTFRAVIMEHNLEFETVKQAKKTAKQIGNYAYDIIRSCKNPYSRRNIGMTWLRDLSNREYLIRTCAENRYRRQEGTELERHKRQYQACEEDGIFDELDRRIDDFEERFDRLNLEFLKK